MILPPETAILPVWALGPAIAVVVLPSGLGDTFLALPFLRHLRNLEDWNVVVLAQSAEHRLLVNLPGTLVVETEILPLRVYQMVRSINKAQRPIVVFDLQHQTSRDRVELAKSLSPTHIIGFDPELTGRPIDNSAVARYHLSAQYFLIAGLIPDFKAEDRHLPFTPKKVEQAKSVIVFHTDTAPEKMWPTTEWYGLLGELQHLADQMIAIGLWANELRRETAGIAKVVFTERSQSFERQLFILLNASFFIGVDSVFSHIADAHGIPAVKSIAPEALHGWHLKESTSKNIVVRDRDEVDHRLIFQTVTDLLFK
jgi:ADP-heptose:LPS heptosyltransferase